MGLITRICKGLRFSRVSENGYYKVRSTDDPRSDRHGYVYEHRLVAEKKIGRKLASNEVVHHKDRNKKNNKPSNLRVMGRSEHSKLHSRERSRQSGK